MTKVLDKKVKCAKCGKESVQSYVYSINFALGDKESNERLMNYKQECPHCHYQAEDIALLDNENIANN